MATMKNMDDDLEREVREECQRIGNVNNVMTFVVKLFKIFFELYTQNIGTYYFRSLKGS